MFGATISPGRRLTEPTNSATKFDVGDGVDLGRRAELLEPAGPHDPDAVGDRQRFFLVVGHEERRDPDLELNPADLVAQLGAHLGVERGEWLVEQQQAGLDAQRPGEGHPLLLTTRELVRIPLGERGEAHEFEEFTGALVPLGGGYPAHLEPEGHVRERVHVGEEAVGLEDHPNIAAVRGDVGDVLPADEDPALVELLEPGHRPQGCRLAATGGSEQGDELTRSDGDREPVQGVHLVVGAAAVDKFERRPHRGAALLRGARFSVARSSS